MLSEVRKEGTNIHLHPACDIGKKYIQYNALVRSITNKCSDCSIRDSCSIASMPVGTFNASKMLIDSNPDDFDVYGGAFTGDSLKVLYDAYYALLTKLKYNNTNNVSFKSFESCMNDIYGTYIIKCDGVKHLDNEVIKHCVERYLAKEFELVNPEKIFLTYNAYQVMVKHNMIKVQGSGSLTYGKEFVCHNNIINQYQTACIIHNFTDSNINPDTLHCLFF